MKSGRERWTYRPKKEKSSNLAERNLLAVNHLDDSARDPQRVPIFASSHKLRSKSAKLYKNEAKDSKRESIKRAWAPDSLHPATCVSAYPVGHKESIVKSATFVHRDEPYFGRVGQGHLVLKYSYVRIAVCVSKIFLFLS